MVPLGRVPLARRPDVVVRNGVRVQLDVAHHALADHVQQPPGQLAGDAVADEPPLPVRLHHAERPQQSQRVGDGAVAHPDSDGEIGDAEIAGVVQGQQDRQPVGVAQPVQHGSGVAHLSAVGEHGRGVAHLIRVDHPQVTACLRDLVHGYPFCAAGFWALAAAFAACLNSRTFASDPASTTSATDMCTPSRP